MRRILRLSAVLLLMGTLPGCYTARNSVPSHIKSIAIPVFANKSLQSAVEDELTQKVIERFQSNNQLRLAEPGEADAELDGTITTYTNRVYRFNNQERADEYIVTITLDVGVMDRAKNRELWSQEGIRASATYLISGAQARTEADARKEAVAQLADILLSRTVEGW